jgi:hypothetical protein
VWGYSGVDEMSIEKSPAAQPCNLTAPYTRGRLDLKEAMGILWSQTILDTLGVVSLETSRQ